MSHIPVLLQEIVHFVTEDLRNPAVVVDGTMNGGGHAEAIIEKMQPGDTYIGCDVDQLALDRSKERLQSLITDRGVRLIQYNGSFADIPTVLTNNGVDSCDRILLDLGWSMDQFDDASRGFSFQNNGPLDMRLAFPPDPDSESAAQIVMESSVDELTDLIETLGEEPHAKRIARAIVEYRKHTPITTTHQLAKIIESIIPRRTKTHPATKTFQALRIAVNSELSVLSCIGELARTLRPGGRLLVITFHSLEDRIVKSALRESVQMGGFKTLTKNTVKPSRLEITGNPRSRSAQLRVIQSLEI